MFAMNSVYLRYSSIHSLDSSKLDQLINLGRDIDEDVLGQLLGVHKETSELILNDMRKFFTEKNYAELKRCAHKYKSSSANLGLIKLQKLCADLETKLGQAATFNHDEYNQIFEFIDSITFESHQTSLKLNSYGKVA